MDNLSFVFFGMDGTFSIHALDSLIDAALKPSLVIAGTRYPERKRFRGLYDSNKRKPHGLSAHAKGRGIEAHETDDVHREASMREISKVHPQFFVLAGFHQILKPSVLQLQTITGLNLHPGKLPEERGPSPLFWRLKLGHKTVWYTIHLLHEKADAGPIVVQEELNFTPGDPIQKIYGDLAAHAGASWVEAVQHLLKGDMKSSPQNETYAAHHSRPGYADFQIDPTQSASSIYAFASAFCSTYPLYVESGGDEYLIQQVKGYDSEAKLPSEYALLGTRLFLSANPGVVEFEVDTNS